MEKSLEAKNIKGEVGLFLMTFITLFAILTSLAVYWYTTNQISKVKLDVELTIRKNDVGSWSTAFLKSTVDSLSYMELLGDTKSGNYKESIGRYIYKKDGAPNSIENIIEKWHSIDGIKRQINLNGITVGTIEDQKIRLLLDIPLPGGQKSQIEILES